MSAPAASAPAPLVAAGEKLRRARELVLSVRTAYALGVLIAIQWLAVLAFALTVRHNGWLFYSGGDQLWHYTDAYVLAHRLQPPSFVGYGWSMLLLPITYFTGPNLVSALPVIVLFNTLVLLPVALLCIYGIATRIGGQLFGYWAAALWIALPYFGILFVEPGYHQKYTELTIPHIVGLTAMSDFPSMVGLLVSAYFCLRALESGSRLTMVAAGFAAGYAIAVKPSSAIFLFGPALLLLLTRWRTVFPFLLGLAPALATLALWKYRGLGHLGATQEEPVRLASGVGDLLRRIHNPDANSWSHFHENLIAIREHFWVARVLEWLPLAGALALFARARRAFWLIVPWFAAFLAIKGSYVDARMDDASFFRILLPAFPAFVLLMAAIPLLFPGARPKPAPAPASASARPEARSRRRCRLRRVRSLPGRRHRRGAARGRREPHDGLLRDARAGARSRPRGLGQRKRRAAHLGLAPRTARQDVLRGPALDRPRRRCHVRALRQRQRRLSSHRAELDPDAVDLARRPSGQWNLELPRRGIGELAEQRSARGRVRPERAGRDHGSVTPSRSCCSSSASRWARIVFWSESREMTVE